MPADSPSEPEPFLPTAPEFLRDLGFPGRTRLRSRWTLVDGLSLHSRENDAAGAKPYVLIHGLVISSLYMIPLAECLAVKHRVIALDLPGFGRSAAPPKVLSVAELANLVIRWLTDLGIEECHLVANSFGGQVAARIAVAAPHLVASMTLIGPTIDPDARRLPAQFLRLLRDALHEPPRLWANWLFDFARAGLRRAVGTTRAMFQDHIEEQLPAIHAQTLIIRGERDPTMPKSWGEKAVAALPQGRLFVLPNCWHCAHYTRPEQVSEIIIAHAQPTLATTAQTAIHVPR